MNKILPIKKCLRIKVTYLAKRSRFKTDFSFKIGALQNCLRALIFFRAKDLLKTITSSNYINLFKVIYSFKTSQMA